MKRILLALALPLALLGCTTTARDAIQLVSNGKSNYIIVIPVNANDVEKRAAQFLQSHICAISDIELPIRQTDSLAPEHAIVIASNPDITCDDGFEIATVDNQLIIKGGKGRGCIYAVSEILDKYLGVKYLSPDFVSIPKSKDLALPALCIAHSSPNTYRNINGDFSKNRDYKDFHRLHTNDDMFADGYYVHTFHRLMPWAEYFEKKPEYYAYMNGKRIIDQLCLSNEDVYRIVASRLREEMKQQPHKNVWSVSQDDNFSYCQCEKCSKIIEEESSPAGPIIRFVNRIAEEFPDKIISTLAYQYSRQAPVKTKPADNVQIMLCTIELNRSKAIAEDSASVSFVNDMNNWRKICNNIYLWDYTVNFNHYISPFPNLHTLQPNIQLFVKNNAGMHFQQSNTGAGHEFSELKSYLLAKLLWNPNADVQALIDEFTDGYYGPAAKWIRKYIRRMEHEIIQSGKPLNIYEPPTNHQFGFLSEKNIAAYNRYFNKAEKAVANEPRYLLHVRTARMALQYAMMEIGKNDMFGPRGWYKEGNGDFIPIGEMVDMLEDFYHTAMECGTKDINESGLSPEQYYLATKRFIEVQVKGNIAFRKQVIATPPPARKYSEGNLAYLTNGVRGANDYNVHWIGWEAQDFSLTVDLEQSAGASSIEISTLWDPKSWILHPLSISCYTSVDGANYKLISTQAVTGSQRNEEVNRVFRFDASGEEFRYVKFDITGTKTLFSWHPSAGGDSWVFVDEIVVR